MTRTILRGARVFDGTGRGNPERQTVVIEDDRIAGVAADGSAPSAAGRTAGDGGPSSTIDLSGCTLLPGLIDLHVHLGWGPAAPCRVLRRWRSRRPETSGPRRPPGSRVSATSAPRAASRWPCAMRSREATCRVPASIPAVRSSA